MIYREKLGRPPVWKDTPFLPFYRTDQQLYAATADGIYYLAQVRAVSPQEGNVEGGEPITIFGRRFSVWNNCYNWRTVSNRPSEVTNTLITGITPPGVVGEADIEVHLPDSGILTFERWKFLYTNTRSVTLTMTPTHGPQMGGGTGIITGGSFTPSAVVKIGHNPASDVVVAPTLIHFTIPPGTVGTVGITVTTPDGTEWISENGYTYDPFPPPSIDGIHPNRGPAAGGTEITIRGNHFRDGAVVTIGGIQVEQLDNISLLEIRLKTPPSPPGRKDVYVVNPDGQQAEKIGGFVYNPPVTITSIKPNVGVTRGGTTVTIIGT